MKLFSLSLVFLLGCQTFFDNRVIGYEERRMVFQVVPMLLQESSKDNAALAWNGDWVFRRERIRLLDVQLQEIKPDIVLFQDLVYRDDSPSESEVKLLSAGSLTDYKWHIVNVGHDPLSEEDIASGVAVAAPTKLDYLKTLAAKDIYRLNDSKSYVVVTRFSTDNGPAGLVSIKLNNATELDYLRLKRTLEEIFSQTKICPERFILAGYIPGSHYLINEIKEINSLNFKDVATGFCDDVSSCYTEESSNPLRARRNEKSVDSRNVRVYLHRKALVYSSKRNLTNSMQLRKDRDNYNLGRLTVSDKYGWWTAFALPVCKP